MSTSDKCAHGYSLEENCPQCDDNAVEATDDEMQKPLIPHMEGSKERISTKRRFFNSIFFYSICIVVFLLVFAWWAAVRYIVFGPYGIAPQYVASTSTYTVILLSNDGATTLSPPPTPTTNLAATAQASLQAWLPWLIWVGLIGGLLILGITIVRRASR
ncbi:MAG: hypothetical protein ABSF63_13310 [Candidatus Bathyarchaeia archaeon]|jgi:cytoskeletal protein RodZ